MLFAATSALACACQPGLEGAAATSETFRAASPSAAPVDSADGAVLGSEHAAATTTTMAKPANQDLLPDIRPPRSDLTGSLLKRGGRDRFDGLLRQPCRAYVGD